MAMRVIARLFLIGMLLVPVNVAEAVQPDEILEDPGLEQRARKISLELRCLVCQNQSIDDSNAPLAKDLRVLVRERLVAGDSDAAVIDFVVARYGEFVLLKPRFGTHTLVLWLGAPLILFLASVAIFLSWRRRQKVQASPAALSQAERDRLDSLLEDS